MTIYFWQLFRTSEPSTLNLSLQIEPFYYDLRKHVVQLCSLCLLSSWNIVNRLKRGWHFKKTRLLKKLKHKIKVGKRVSLSLTFIYFLISFSSFFLIPTFFSILERFTLEFALVVNRMQIQFHHKWQVCATGINAES